MPMYSLACLGSQSAKTFIFVAHLQKLFANSKVLITLLLVNCVGCINIFSGLSKIGMNGCHDASL